MMLADTALGRIQPVMDAPTLAVPEHPQTPKDNRVVFRDVSFTYDGAQSPPCPMSPSPAESERRWRWWALRAEARPLPPA